MGSYLEELQQKLARLQQNDNEQPIPLSPEYGEETSPGWFDCSLSQPQLNPDRLERSQ